MYLSMHRASRRTMRLLWRLLRKLFPCTHKGRWRTAVKWDPMITGITGSGTTPTWGRGCQARWWARWCGSLGNSGGINSVYFSISHKDFFLLLQRISQGKKRAIENSKGLLFDAYQGQKTRLVIPVFRNLFFGPQKAFLTGFLRIWFLPANSGGIFHRNVVLEGVTVIPVFSNFTGIFRRNSWWTGIPVFTPDSSGFRRIPEDSCSRQKLLALASDKRRLFVK